ncbi:MAG: 50S ribosomal protein L18 [Candidatus Woesebacteria bacterium]|jgi:large subunit ribosomal protein L18
MSKATQKIVNRLLRKNRVRAIVSGTTERPRLSVRISNRHINAQIIDDTKQKTLAGTTTATTKAATGNLTEKAAWVGADIAKKAKKAGVTKVVFDRGGRQYKARLQALAEAARKEGLEF